MSTAERIPVLEYGTSSLVYADRLVIEQHGPVSHLLFCNIQREAPGLENRIAHVNIRLVVPTAMLPQLVRQLACPEAQGPIPTEMWNEAYRH